MTAINNYKKIFGALLGAFARANIADSIQDTKYIDAPEWFKNWEKTGLLKFEDKNKDGLIQYSGDMDTNEMVKVD